MLEKYGNKHLAFVVYDYSLRGHEDSVLDYRQPVNSKLAYSARLPGRTKNGLAYEV